MEATPSKHNDVQIFHRMTLRERGNGGGGMLWLSIREIHINAAGITFVRGSREFTYRWTDIHSAIIRKAKRSRHPLSSYGSTEEMFVLRTADKVFKFDISPSSPDFRDSGVLVEQLKKYLHVKSEVDKYKDVREQILVIGILVLVGAVIFWFDPN